MPELLPSLRINDFSHVKDAHAQVSVDPLLDTGDGLVEEICPSVFTLGEVDCIAQTRFGKFLGSVSNKGFAGLRPVLESELGAVIEACEDDPSESTRLELIAGSVERMWVNFVGNSMTDMIGRVTLKLTDKNPVLVYPRHDISDDLLRKHFLRVATTLDVKPVEVERYEYRSNGRFMSGYRQNDCIARIDSLELFGADDLLSSGERDELVSTVRGLADNLGDAEYIDARRAGVLEPLRLITAQINAQLYS